MKRKRLLAGALALAMTVGMAVTPAGAVFTDTAGHWASGAIDKWSQEYGIIQGYEDGTFRPDNSITRGAFAGILDRFMKYQAISSAATFTDTAGTYWEQPILKLHAAGVYLGNNGQALSTDTITRQQAVAMIARAFGITGQSTALTYLDEDQIADYARPYVAEMTARGYINDSANGYFRPTDAITRAEIVNILNNMVDVLIQEQGTYSDMVEGSLMINASEGAELLDMSIGGNLIIAPGVTGTVTLTNVAIGGDILNFGSAELKVLEPEEEKPDTPDKDEKPEEPAEPSKYPWVAADGYVNYDNYNVPIYSGVETSKVAQPDFVWDDEDTDRLVYVGREYDTRFGIDVSAYQNQATAGKTIDWEAVANDGVEFVMVRAGFRGYGTGSLNRDAYCLQNVDGAMDAGLETGVYFFSQAITVEEAIEEADYVLSILDGRKITGPIAYDWEMHDSTYRVYGTTPEVATACALAFCQRIEEAGYEPMVYMSKYVGYNKFNLPQLAKYPIWFPEYKSASSERLYPAFYYQMDIWQFSSSCSIDGIGGRVDANIQFLR